MSSNADLGRFPSDETDAGADDDAGGMVSLLLSVSIAEGQGGLIGVSGADMLPGAEDDDGI